MYLGHLAGHLVHLSVAICTHNRSASLQRTLVSLTELHIPAGVTWELIVVDNASRDGTATTIAAFQDVLPLRAIEEPNLGKSHAANAAVRAATGEYILWTDDDVLVESTWLTAYHAAFVQWPTDAFFGGPVAPVFDGTSPAWLAGALRHIGNVFAAVDYGPQSVTLEGDRLPYGANMAIRRAEHQRFPFDPRLGPRGATMLFGEEWELCKSMLTSGATGRWVPAARAQHMIPPERQTLRYVRAYYVGNGRSLASVYLAQGEAAFLGRPRWVWREALVHEVLFRIRRLYAPSEVWSENLKRAGVAWGMLQRKRA